MVNSRAKGVRGELEWRDHLRLSCPSGASDEIMHGLTLAIDELPVRWDDE